MLLYLRFISNQVKWFINKLLSMIVLTFNTFFQTVALLVTGVGRLIAYIMSFPYGILRWLALLLFRIGEAVGKDTISRVRPRISKTPRE